MIFMNTANATTYENATLGKVTMYRIGGLGAYVKTELSSVSVEIKPDSAKRFGEQKLVVRSVKKGCRKPDAYGYSDHVGIVFVDGWNTFDPASAFDTTGASKVCFDDGYASDFDRMLAASGAKIMADYRGFNAQK